MVVIVESRTQYNQLINNTKKKNTVLLVDYFTTWCGPCKMLAPVLQSVADHFANNDRVVVVKVDVQEHEDIGDDENVASIPTLKVFNNGSEVDCTSGFKSKEELIALIEKHL